MRQLPLLGFPRFIANKLFQTFFFSLHILLWVSNTQIKKKIQIAMPSIYNNKLLRCLILPCRLPYELPVIDSTTASMMNNRKMFRAKYLKFNWILISKEHGWKKLILSYSNLSSTIQDHEMIKTCISCIMIWLKLYQTLVHTRYMIT
jgi:hypothetical protein